MADYITKTQTVWRKLWLKCFNRMKRRALLRDICLPDIGLLPGWRSPGAYDNAENKGRQRSGH